ncbi:MAG TPA: DUF58 domain-containing protein [Clostridia bacterium]|nr:DUF58 domain-containing protein [Clostridia bacterium]
MSTSRIIYSILILASLYFVYFYGGVVPWALFYLVILLPLVSFSYLLITYFSFTYIEKSSATTYIKGEKMLYRCSFANNMLLPSVYTKIFIQTPDSLVRGGCDILNESVVMGKGRKIEYEIDCRYRGRYEIGIMKVEFTDFLNLFRLVLKKSAYNSVLVFPRIKVSNELINDGMTLSDFRVAMFNKSKGEETMVNLREYAYGDSSRLIHWKLSARLNKLMVTDKESTFDSRIFIVVDLKKIDRPLSERIVYEDLLVEEIVSTANYFLGKGVPVDLVYYNNGINIVHGASMKDFDDIYNLMAEIEFSSEEGIEEVMYPIFDEENTNNTFFIFSLELGSSLYEVLTKIHLMEKRIFVRYCEIDIEDDEVYNYKRMLMKQGIEIEKLEEESRREDDEGQDS